MRCGAVRCRPAAALRGGARRVPLPDGARGLASSFGSGGLGAPREPAEVSGQMKLGVSAPQR